MVLLPEAMQRHAWWLERPLVVHPFGDVIAPAYDAIGHGSDSEIAILETGVLGRAIRDVLFEVLDIRCVEISYAVHIFI